VQRIQRRPAIVVRRRVHRRPVRPLPPVRRQRERHEHRRPIHPTRRPPERSPHRPVLHRHPRQVRHVLTVPGRPHPALRLRSKAETRPRRALAAQRRAPSRDATPLALLHPQHTVPVRERRAPRHQRPTTTGRHQAHLPGHGCRLGRRSAGTVESGVGHRRHRLGRNPDDDGRPARGRALIRTE
jgi:hypothetical protein